MAKVFKMFEKIARSAYQFGEPERLPLEEEHPFDVRDIHPKFPTIVRNLFDDGHYAQSTFEAYKFIDKKVQQLSGETGSGFNLMMRVFPENSPIIKITSCSSTSERDEQKGFQFLFAGSVLAIRNPRGHEYAVSDDPDTCLDHLSLASMLLRRLEKAGYRIK